MPFLKPFGEEVNPLTGYPFRKKNLDERIAKLRPDLIKNGFILVEAMPSKNDEKIRVAKPSPSAVRPFKITPNRIRGNIAALKINPFFLEDNDANNSSQVLDVPLPPSTHSNSSKKCLVKMNVCESDDRPGTSSSMIFTPVAPSLIQPKFSGTRAGGIPIASTSTAPYNATIDRPVPAPISTVASTSVASNFYGDKSHICSVASTSILLSKSISTLLKRPAESSKKIATVKDLPSAKRNKLEFKHSFTFLDNNNKEKEAKKRDRAMFRCMGCFDWGLKEHERNQAYKELAELCQSLWPNPREVMKDEKVTAMNVNEFIKDDVYEMMLDEALNNPDLFDAHEIIYTKKNKGTK